QTFQRGRDVNDVLAVTTHRGVAFRGDDDYLAATGADFFDVADDFVVLQALGGDEDYRHAFVDQGDGAMLHLGGGHALGVNVTDFFQLQGAFQGDGVMVAAA